MLQAVFYGKCPDQDFPDHWLLFSISLPSPVRVESCPYHGGPAILNELLRKGRADSADADKGFSDQEPTSPEYEGAE